MYITHVFLIKQLKFVNTTINNILESNYIIFHLKVLNLNSPILNKFVRFHK